MLVSDNLKGAARVLRERGWGQRYGLCAVRAIGIAAGHLDIPYADADVGVVRALAEALGLHVGISHSGAVAIWNDMPGRTAAEVIEALERAAVIETAKESASEPVAVEVPHAVK